MSTREEPSGVAVGGKNPNDGFEVDSAGLLIKIGALGTSVLEKFLASGVSDETIESKKALRTGALSRWRRHDVCVARALRNRTPTAGVGRLKRDRGV